MPKSYMIKRYRKKGGSNTEAKNVQNRNIQDLSTDKSQDDISSFSNQEQLNDPNLQFKLEEKCTKQDLSSVTRIQQRSTENYTETIPVFGKGITNSALDNQHQMVSSHGASFTQDHCSQHSILSGFSNMFHHTHIAPLYFKPSSDGVIACGIPDNISPKSATSAKESPTFPTDAIVPTQWSPHSYQLTPKADIFNFDPKFPLKSSDHISSFKTEECHKCNGRQFAVSAKYIPEHIPVFPTDKSVIGQNSSTLFDRYSPKYFHGNTSAVIKEKDPIGQFPTDKAFAFSLQKNLPGINNPFNMFCNIPMYKSNAEVELSAIRKPSSIPSKSIELVNGGFGLTNPALAPLVINDDTVKAKQSNQICACQVCGLIFHKPKLLTRHIKKMHDKIKKYLCRFCPKGFNDKFDLKRHTRIHTGIKPFKCHNCGKGFSQRCSLEAHERKVHSQEVRFEPKQRRDKMHICEECGSTTKDPDMHYFHIKQNHPNSSLLSKFHDKRQFKSTITRTDGASIRATNSNEYTEKA